MLQMLPCVHVRVSTALGVHAGISVPISPRSSRVRCVAVCLQRARSTACGWSWLSPSKISSSRSSKSHRRCRCVAAGGRVSESSTCSLASSRAQQCDDCVFCACSAPPPTLSIEECQRDEAMDCKVRHCVSLTRHASYIVTSNTCSCRSLFLAANALLYEMC